jgi:anti-sigma B factor antagonist
MSQPFSMTIKTKSQGVVAAFQGMATVATAEAFEGEINRLIVMKPKLAVLDLSELQFMSSFAVSAFLRLQSEVKMAGGAVRIAAPSEYIMNLLQATRVDQRLVVYPTVDAALAGTRAAAA